LDELRHQLLDLRASIIAKVESHFMLAESHETVLPDELDQAARDQDRGMLLLLAEKERGLINEIDAALLRFDDGTYGQCEGTSEPIGYKRLQARPWARYSVAFKEMLEREERGYNRG
jgi:DnaK suppressor protein